MILRAGPALSFHSLGGKRQEALPGVRWREGRKGDRGSGASFISGGDPRKPCKEEAFSARMVEPLCGIPGSWMFHLQSLFLKLIHSWKELGNLISRKRVH